MYRSNFKYEEDQASEDSGRLSQFPVKGCELYIVCCLLINFIGLRSFFEAYVSARRGASNMDHNQTLSSLSSTYNL